MVKIDFPWLDELGIKKDIFNDIPEGENPLPWAFKSGFLKESAYSLWASSHYKHPLIKDEFFSLAFDVSLIEKFSKLYTWSETCYPIYFWENTLFIACLEPIEIQSDYKVCFAISSYSTMASAWSKYTSKLSPIITPSTNEFLVNLTVEQISNEAKTIVLKSELPPIPVKNKVTNTENSDLESLDALDFSSLSPMVSEQEQEQDIDVHVDLKDSEHTQTSSNVSFNILTSATSLSSGTHDIEDDNINSLPLPDMSLIKSDFESEMQSEEPEAPTVTETNEFSSADSESWTNEQQNDSELNDDYTPLPFLTKTEQVRNKNLTNTRPNSEQTVTDHARPIDIPKENLISEVDINKNSTLTADNGRKGIIAHVFHHLKKDYKKLMWAELIEEGQFYPKYCFGPWEINSKAWETPINISQPNIFKIAYSTSLPFHGEISDNHFNDQYIGAWLRNIKPDFATVYPVCYDDYCYGFIVGMFKGTDFDELKSLKKIENLISICKNQFLSLQNKKAS